jgi:hypothetical protein
VNIEDLAVMDRNEAPYKQLAAKNPYYQNKKMVRLALEYLETGHAGDDFKWSKWHEKLGTSLKGRPNDSATITPTDNDSNKHKDDDRDDKSRMATIKEERETFYQNWNRFMEQRGIEIIDPPNTGAASIDNYQLYRTVVEKGGMVHLTKEPHLWEEICEALKVSLPPTNFPKLVKKYYKK